MASTYQPERVLLDSFARHPAEFRPVMVAWLYGNPDLADLAAMVRGFYEIEDPSPVRTATEGDQ